LDIQHHCWRLALAGKLFIAPVSSDVHNVIDIGTGGGQWAIEFADKYPSANVIGTDLSPIQPEWTPPNCSWLVDNAEQEWVFDTKFDFIHSRMLMMGIHDWPKYFQQAWENLKPGGWVEVQEPLFPIGYVDDGNITADSPCLLWSNYIKDAAAKDGIDTLAPQQHFRTYLEKQGFVNIREQKVVWPCGPWSKGNREKVLGHWVLENTKIFLGGTVMLFTKRLGWTKEAVDELVVKVKADMDNKKSHYFWEFYIYSAQKPEDHV